MAAVSLSPSCVICFVFIFITVYFEHFISPQYILLLYIYIYDVRVEEVVDLFTDEVSIVSLPLIVFLKRKKIEMCQQATSHRCSIN